MSKNPPRVNILGVGISTVDTAQTLDIMNGWIARREPHYLCLAPVHNVMDCRRDPDLKRIFNASGLTVPDGMPLAWLLRLKGYRHVDRVYGPDLLLAACERSDEHGYRHFFYGGAEDVAEEMAYLLMKRFPGLQVAGCSSPPFRPLKPEEDRLEVEKINAARPDVLWVGLGAPKQERWMGEHFGRIEVPVMVGVGAAFDFLSGNKPQAPFWMQRSGLEWLFRLMTEPRRLWRRYLINNPLFVVLVLSQALGLRKFSIES